MMIHFDTPEFRKLILDNHPRIKSNEEAIKYIAYTGTSGLVRFVMDGDSKKLQQRHSFIVHYNYPVTRGSYDSYIEEYGNIWLDVPVEENIP